MQKNTLLLFLSLGISINGMESNNLGLIFESHDVLPRLTKQICKTHGHQPDLIKKDFHALSLTNTSLCSYYTDEKTQQDVIDSCLKHSRFTNHQTVAELLNCKKITTKIKHFHEVALDQSKTFTQEDLEGLHNHWYLNIYIGHLHPLLNTVIKQRDIEKIRIMINNPHIQIRSIYKNVIFPCPLSYAIICRQNCNKKDEDEYLPIAQLLLTKVNPNNRTNIEQFTPLMWVSSAGDKEMARLLLEHGANPYLVVDVMNWSKNLYTKDTPIHSLVPDSKRLYVENAFTLEFGEPKGWLKAMVDEVAQKKNNP